jgi:hypothetical protein
MSSTVNDHLKYAAAAMDFTSDRGYNERKRHVLAGAAL